MKRTANAAGFSVTQVPNKPEDVKFHVSSIGNGKRELWCALPGTTTYTFVQLPNAMSKEDAARHVATLTAFADAKYQDALKSVFDNEVKALKVKEPKAPKPAKVAKEPKPAAVKKEKTVKTEDVKPVTADGKKKSTLEIMKEVQARIDARKAPQVEVKQTEPVAEPVVVGDADPGELPEFLKR